MAFDPKAQRLRALAAYQLLKAKAEATLGAASVDKALLAVLAKAAVLAAKAGGDSLEVAVRASLLKAVTTTGKFFILLEPADVAQTTEQILRSISKLTRDDFRAVDAAYRGLSKPAQDHAGVLDSRRTLLGKRASDAVGSSDLLRSRFDKSRADLVHAPDITVRSVSKVASDLARFSDHKDLFVSKLAQDASSVSDALDRIVSYVRVFTDSVDATDGVSVVAFTDDGEVMQFNKELRDSATTGESRAFDLSKPLYDATISSELATYAMGKPLADGFLSSTETSFSFEKPLADSFSATERAIYSISKRLVDNFANSDFVVNHFEKSVHDYVSTSDRIRFATQLSRFDSLTAVEQADVVRIAASGVPAQIEHLNVSELAALLTRKFFFESLDATDDFLQETTVDDDQTVTFKKNVPELLQTVERRSFSMQRSPISETIGANDSGSLFWTDYCDSSYFSQSYVGQERTFT
jgi:hypothetical protein